MKSENIPISLDDLLEEPFAGGHELPTTAFYVLGIPTVWMYTTWAIFKAIARHFELRRRYFARLFEGVPLSERSAQLYDLLTTEGFNLKPMSRTATLALYSASMVAVVLVIGLILVFRFALILAEVFDPAMKITTFTATSTFCVSIVLLTWWVCQGLNEMIDRIERFIRSGRRSNRRRK